MERSTNQRVLWALGVVSVIVGSLCVAGAALLQAVGGLLTSASPESPGWADFDFSHMQDIEAGLTVICVILVAVGLAYIGLGVFGMRTANGDARGVGCFVFCGISLAVDLAAIAIGLLSGAPAAGLMVLIVLVAVFCWRNRLELGEAAERADLPEEA